MNTKQLRQKILDLAIRGKLVPQDSNDEPASVLLERVKAEKERLIAEGKIKRSKKSAASSDKPHYPFEIPSNWIWVTIGDLGDIVTGTTPSKSNKDFYNGKYPFFKPTDLEQGINTVSSTDSLTEQGFSVARRLSKHSVLVTCIGATIGKTGLIQRSGSCNQQINAIVPNHEINARLIYYFCISGFLQDAIISNSSATTLPILNKNDFSKLLFPLPPTNEQNRIVYEIEKWFEVIGIIEFENDELNAVLAQVKSKVLELAISGKLVQQDPSDEPAEVLLKRVNPNAVVSADTSHYKFDIPNNWIISQLGNLFNHNTGKALNRSKQEGTMLDYITTSNLYWDRFDLNNLKQMPFKESEIDKCTVIKGDLLVCEGGDVGRAAIWNYDYSICIQNHLHRLRPIDNHLVFPRFYYYCFLLYKQQNLIGGKGIGIQGLSSNQLHKVVFPLPPLNEQKRIASKVDGLFAVIDQIQQSLE